MCIRDRSRRAHLSLSQQFEQHTISKTYVAIVMGELVGDGEVDLPVDGRPAVTRWRAVRCEPSGSFEWGAVTVVEAFPITGRTHQIRIHLKSLGHPIVGDDLHFVPHYTVLRKSGLFLSCVSVEFEHPITRERTSVKCSPPDKFNTFVRRQGARIAQKKQTAARAEQGLRGSAGDHDEWSTHVAQILSELIVGSQQLPDFTNAVLLRVYESVIRRLGSSECVGAVLSLVLCKLGYTDGTDHVLWERRASELHCAVVLKKRPTLRGIAISRFLTRKLT
eukprot:TRINITY_DN17687_c0_g1_i1.p1 TRINITY_DN17687_c0_g1~~TRINITY_DN17687_c0_g1_i1.p1  ORF type:complete len:277 (+),score=39.60 TRINITY_DN17687_c0_g1_i1:115-945(+)